MKTDSILIYNAVLRERQYQEDKWGDNPHTIENWLHIMQHELTEAAMGKSPREQLAEILQVIAVGFACLQQYEVVERIRSETESMPERIDHVTGYGHEL